MVPIHPVIHQHSKIDFKSIARMHISATPLVSAKDGPVPFCFGRCVMALEEMMGSAAEPVIQNCISDFRPTNISRPFSHTHTHIWASLVSH